MEIKQWNYDTYWTQRLLFFSKICFALPVIIPANSCVTHCFALWRSKSECGLSNVAWNILMAINSYSFFIPSHKLWSNTDTMQWTCDVCDIVENFNFWKKLLFMSHLFSFSKMNVLCVEIIDLIYNQEEFCLAGLNKS